MDLNTLLSFNEDLTDKEIDEVINNFFSDLAKENFQETFEKSIKKIQEYPNSDKLILNIAMSLSGGLYMFNIDNKEDFEKKLDELYDKCANSDDLEIKSQAISLLVGKYTTQKDFEKAQNYLDQLPNSSYNKAVNQGNIYIATNQNQKALEIFEDDILKSATKLTDVLIRMMGVAVKENRNHDAEYLVGVIEKTTELFELWDYNAHYAYFELYSLQKDEENFLSCLEKLLESLIKLYDFDLSKTNLYKHIKSKEQSGNGQKQFLNTIVEMLRKDADGTLEFIKEDPRFIELLNKYS